MKTKTLCRIAPILIFLSFTFFTCPTKEDLTPLDITGKWILDSVYAGCSETDSVLLQQAMALRKKTSFTFNNDSTFIRASLKDSIKGRYSARTNRLDLDEGHGSIALTIKTKNDSLFTFVHRGHIVFVLKKK